MCTGMTCIRSSSDSGGIAAVVNVLDFYDGRCFRYMEKMPELEIAAGGGYGTTGGMVGNQTLDGIMQMTNCMFPGILMEARSSSRQEV